MVLLMVYGFADCFADGCADGFDVFVHGQISAW